MASRCSGPLGLLEKLAPIGAETDVAQEVDVLQEAEDPPKKPNQHPGLPGNRTPALHGPP
eukprot:11224217-Lingulodinium_polyedra.AAC.1